jgi:Tol biopolymer transport system component
MKARASAHRLRMVAIVASFGLLFSQTNASQLVSQPNAALGGGSHANGDSGPSIISTDGRYVLFSSAANNLVLTANTNPIPIEIPAKLNVYLRDRSNDVTTLVSVNLNGAGGNGDSFAAGISSNGQFALFESSATDLVPGDPSLANNMAKDIYLRDVFNGTTTLVSVSTNGGFGNGLSRTPVMTPDGRYVAFVSAASNLVAGDANGIPDIFVRDMQSGTTTLASPGAMPTSVTPVTGGSAAPAITPDGRYVVFYSTATNLVPGVTTVGDIYVRDLVGTTTYWASSGARSQLQSVLGTTNGVCFSPRISADGTLVAYEVSAANYANTAGIVLRWHLPGGSTDVVSTNANAPVYNYEDIHTVDMSADGRFVASVANTDSGGVNTAIWLWDAVTGTNLLVSATVSNSVPTNVVCCAPLLDASGRYVAFMSNATNLTTNALSGAFHLYCRDTQAGTTVLVDANTNGVGMGVSPETFPSWDAAARYLTYENAGVSDRNQYFDVLLCDLMSNATEVVSVPGPAFSFQSPDGPSVLLSGSFSTEASHVAFVSDADNLAPGATNGYRNVYVGDLLAGDNILVSANTNGVAGSGNSSQPSITADGRFVAFTSWANDLVPGDANHASDVFVRDLEWDTTTLVSVNANGTGFGNSNSFSPVISSDGRFVLFQSQAQNLAAGSFGSGVTNLFLRDMESNVTYALTAASSGGVASAAMTPDGHYVAFIGNLTVSSPAYLYVWDSYQAMLIYTNAAISQGLVSISPDGQRLAYTNSGGLFVADLVAPTNNATITSGSLASQPGLNFSVNGQFLVYATAVPASGPNTNGQVYLYDVLGKTNLFVSANAAGNGASDSPVISPDGRFVAYRSYAGNLVPGDSNGVPDIFLYDRNSGATTLLSANWSGSASGANRSSNPFFSADGQTLVFQSAAYDLVTNDFNRNGDVFAVNLFAAGMIPVFYVQAMPSTASSSATLVWPVLAGKTYQVLYKNNLTDPTWQVLSGNITILGNTAYFTDSNPAAGQRFYQIVGN